MNVPPYLCRLVRRGWRATAAGTRSETQLLALAPAALQDMAVTAADAVAAAYLADAAAAGPSAVARQAAAAAPWQAGAADEQQGADKAGSAAEQQRLQQQQRQPDSKWRQQQGVLPALRSTKGSSSGAPSSDGPSTSSRPLEAGWWPTFVHRQLGSTRQLQRFANGVALQRWLYRQYRGVVDIYEDRLQLWAISNGGRCLEVGWGGSGLGQGQRAALLSCLHITAPAAAHTPVGCFPSQSFPPLSAFSLSRFPPSRCCPRRFATSGPKRAHEANARARPPVGPTLRRCACCSRFVCCPACRYPASQQGLLYAAALLVVFVLVWVGMG